MTSTNPDCLGHYDFDNIVQYAKKRFIEGYGTVTLMAQAGSRREKEEIALVSLLDIRDDQVLDLQLSCRYHKKCRVLDCRDRLRALIRKELGIDKS